MDDTEFYLLFDNLKRRVKSERDSFKWELAQTQTFRDYARATFDELQALRRERDALVAERDDLLADRPDVMQLRGRIDELSIALGKERDSATVLKQTLDNASADLDRERQANNDLMRERDAKQFEVDIVAADRDDKARRYDAMRGERDQYQAEAHRMTRAQLDAERKAAAVNDLASAAAAMVGQKFDRPHDRIVVCGACGSGLRDGIEHSCQQLQEWTAPHGQPDIKYSVDSTSADAALKSARDEVRRLEQIVPPLSVTGLSPTCQMPTPDGLCGNHGHGRRNGFAYCITHWAHVTERS